MANRSARQKHPSEETGVGLMADVRCDTDHDHRQIAIHKGTVAAIVGIEQGCLAIEIIPNAKPVRLFRRTDRDRGVGISAFMRLHTTKDATECVFIGVLPLPSPQFTPVKRK